MQLKVNPAWGGVGWGGGGPIKICRLYWEGGKSRCMWLSHVSCGMCGSERVIVKHLRAFETFIFTGDITLRLKPLIRFMISHENLFNHNDSI